ncbi:Rieske (2Fe-2S) protein [Chitinophaga sancti]|uniref:Ferredoxin subunit of nitrite reductase or a ring-hydroxylating dioxygenase n=1 Tax=Chitinophaga sancti TaxID=1004 RepID=A0A1K1QZ20_9BACT|nr:Rieske (2Fe-2S) protein [Chitinophaga sancti]WQD62086.1 Rieske (2Fe-2S) protein [Chitinophaga sancti]WQG92345.1 Rieske (2Fe-2S) protein [Chitinophaga sancti]SFW64932.1 Ferredoxin subunit of nitrite reductase or a ring-hydroxylating dioxygenase [Chitinophaga sancti]
MNENIPDWKNDFPISQAETTDVTRRQFAKFLCLVSGGLATGSAFVAAKSALFPEKKVTGSHRVCSKNELPVGGTRAFVIEGSATPYILIHLENGAFKAYEQKCTHLSCAVFYKPGTGKIECPCHNGWFDAMTGEVLQGPPPRPLPKLEVEVRGEDIFVTGA